MKIYFAMEIVGDRKAAMEKVAWYLSTQSRYLGAPSFAYEAGGWRIDRKGMLRSPDFTPDAAERTAYVVCALNKAGFTTKGRLHVNLQPEEGGEAAHQNMEALLRGKASLIQQAFGVKDDLAVNLVGRELRTAFFPATLTAREIMAAIQFLLCIYTQAGAQKQVRIKDRPVENPKYAMRCFLLRIGMVGPAYAVTRKTLLANLHGDGSFKSGERASRNERPPVIPIAADTGACDNGLADPFSLAEALADAELICGVNALLQDGDVN